MKTQTKNQLRAICFVLVLIGIFWWANQSPERDDIDYAMPIVDGEVRGYDYENNKWFYNADIQQPHYTKQQLDSAVRYGRSISSREFEDMMEDYIDDQEAWGE